MKASVSTPARRSKRDAAMIPTKYGPACQMPFGWTPASTAVATATAISRATRRDAGILSLPGCEPTAAATNAIVAPRITAPRPCSPGRGDVANVSAMNAIR